MGGRFIVGFGVAITSSAGPAYVSELAHPAYRGLMTGVYNCFWFIGGIPGAFVPAGTEPLVGSKAWRIPLWGQMVYSCIILLAMFLLPESPRWLIAHDRYDEALEVIVSPDQPRGWNMKLTQKQTRYHGEGDRDNPIVQLELKEMLEDISITGSDKRWWDYRELFDSWETRYRTMLVIAMAFFGQVSHNDNEVHSVNIPLTTDLVEWQRSRQLLLSSNAQRSRRQQPKEATYLQWRPKRRLLRRCPYRCYIHGQMGTEAATHGQPVHYYYLLHHHHRSKCHQPRRKPRQNAGRGQIHRQRLKASRGYYSYVVPLRYRLQRGIHTPPNPLSC